MPSFFVKILLKTKFDEREELEASAVSSLIYLNNVTEITDIEIEKVEDEHV